MAYNYSNPLPCHNLNVTGNLTPEAARILIQAQEDITKLGYECNLALSIMGTKSPEPIAEVASV